MTGMARIILGLVYLAAAVGSCGARALQQHQHQNVQVRGFYYLLVGTY